MIVPFFPPSAGGGVHRPLAFVRYLEQHGWRATVVTPALGSFWIQDESLLDDVPASCQVRHTRSLSGQALLSLSRRTRRVAGGGNQVRSSRRFAWLRKVGASILVPDTYVGWYPFAVAEGKRLLGRDSFDAIYSTSPPETSHLIARTLQRRSRLPWVADFRDPWMNLHLFPPPTGVHRRLHRRLEGSICRNARVVVTTRWHSALLRSSYPDTSPPVIIPNGYDHDKMEHFDDVRPSDDRFAVLHSGMLTQKRTAVPVLEGLELFLKARPDARIVVRFVGPRESINDEEMRRRGLQDIVEFHDTISHADSLRLERASHILLLIKHSNPLYLGIVPGKLYEYVGAQRPILAIVPDGEARELVNDLRRGETAPPDDPDAIARALETMYAKYESGALERDYDLSVVPEFQRRHRAAQLAELLNSACGNAPHGSSSPRERS